MRSLMLSSGSQLEAVYETQLLPQVSIESHQNFIPFPIASPACQPKHFSVVVQRLPRCSIFAADEVTLNGFRLFSYRKHLFTDASLTAINLSREEASFNKKISGWNSENLNFEIIGKGSPAYRKVERDGPILLPCSDEPSNFGSWIYRFLPKLLLAEASGLQFHSVMVYQQRWMADLLRLLDFRCEIINHDPLLQYRIIQPLIPSLAVPFVFFRPEVRKCLGIMHDFQDKTISLGDKIYVSRRSQALNRPLSRALENETGLVAALMDVGFKEFIPENYSFAEQVAIFDRARLIVGCGGSNMFGCVFARNAELILDIESGEDWAHGHGNLLASTAGLWSMIKGLQLERGTPPHRNWTIDIAAVTSGFADMLDFL